MIQVPTFFFVLWPFKNSVLCGQFNFQQSIILLPQLLLPPREQHSYSLSFQFSQYPGQ